MHGKADDMDAHSDTLVCDPPDPFPSSGSNVVSVHAVSARYLDKSSILLSSLLTFRNLTSRKTSSSS